jgi:hypothetical protein
MMSLSLHLYVSVFLGMGFWFWFYGCVFTSRNLYVYLLRTALRRRHQSIHCNVIVILPNGVLMYIGLFRREVLSLSFPNNRQYTSP